MSGLTAVIVQPYTSVFWAWAALCDIMPARTGPEPELVFTLGKTGLDAPRSGVPGGLGRNKKGQGFA